MTDYLISDLADPANPLDGTELAEILQAAVSAKIDLQSIANLAKVLGGAGVSQLIQSLGAGGGSFFGFPAVHAFICDDENSWSCFYGNAAAAPNTGAVFGPDNNGNFLLGTGDGLGGLVQGIFIGSAGFVLLGQSYTQSSDGNVGIGIDPDPSAILALGSGANDKGFLPPRMTTAQREAIASPADGLVVYDTDLSSLFINVIDIWVPSSYQRSVLELTGSDNLGFFGPENPFTVNAPTGALIQIPDPTGTGFKFEFELTADLVSGSIIFQTVGFQQLRGNALVMTDSGLVTGFRSFTNDWIVFGNPGVDGFRGDRIVLTDMGDHYHAEVVSYQVGVSATNPFQND